jgi:uncharacterized iron-regulated membrane protein
MRRLLLALHLYAGLVAGVFLVLLSVTGSLMVFEDEIDRVLNPKLTRVRPGEKRLSLAEMKSSLEARYPGRTVVSFSLATRSDLAWGATLASGASEGPLNLAFNQFTGEVLGTEDERNNFVGYVHDFHLRLMLGDTGGSIVTFAAVLLLLLSPSGVILWWPRKLLTVNRRGPIKQLNFELHQVLGIYVSLFLMIFALTAMVIHWENEATGLANQITHSPTPAAPPRPQALTPNAATLSPDRLLSIAESTMPGARATWMLLAGNPVRFAMKYPEDRTPSGRTNVFVDAYSGRVVYQLNSRTGPLGYRMVKLWNREIHTGDIGGIATRVLACVLGLTLPVMAITGPLIWWNRRRMAPRQARRSGGAFL